MSETNYKRGLPLYAIIALLAVSAVCFYVLYYGINDIVGDSTSDFVLADKQDKSIECNNWTFGTTIYKGDQYEFSDNVISVTRFGTDYVPKKRFTRSECRILN